MIVQLAETGDGIVRRDAAFAEDKNSVADFLDNFEDMRAVENHFAAQGFTGLRVWNNDIDRNLEGGLAVIADALRYPNRD